MSSKALLVGIVVPILVLILALVLMFLPQPTTKSHEKYVDPATVETPSDVRPACLYKYSSEVQLRTCPETDATQQEDETL